MNRNMEHLRNQNPGRQAGKMLDQAIGIAEWLGGVDGFQATDLAEAMGVSVATACTTWLPVMERRGWVVREGRRKWSSLILGIDFVTTSRSVIE